ncbi:MAG: hypothetical protein GTO14_18295, partial [Anaerolineales bacterium]|nr:hypothetical protein [Anaerolineales bacterium]
LITLVIGSFLGVVLPFSLASLVVVLGSWSLWEFVQVFAGRNWGHAWRQSRDRVVPLMGLLIGASPWVLYGYWLTQNHPVIAAWSTQNLTPSPPVHHYLIGFGTLLPFGLIGVLKTKPQSSPRGRLLLAWSVSNALMLYAPLGLQRRLSLGLYFPLACLASLGLKALVTKQARYRLALLGLLILSFPSNLIMFSAGLSGVIRHEPSVIHTPGEVGAYTWMAENLPPGSLVLAATDTGNRLPAYADVRVLYGHPFETPEAERQEARVNEMFRWQADAEEGFTRLEAFGVDYVFYGERERAIGEPTWLERCTLIHRAQEVALYAVIEP